MNEIARQQRRDWTQREVVQLLLELARQLNELDNTLAEYEKDYVEKAEAYNMAHSKVFLATKGAQYLRTATADAETHEERLAMNLAQTMVRAQKRKIEILRERIGVGRTAASSLRAELELERVPR